MPKSGQGQSGVVSSRPSVLLNFREVDKLNHPVFDVLVNGKRVAKLVFSPDGRWFVSLDMSSVDVSRVNRVVLEGLAGRTDFLEYVSVLQSRLPDALGMGVSDG